MSFVRMRHPALAAILLAAAAGPVAAQTAAPASGTDRAGVATDLDGKNGTLSDKLGDTNGVIRPQGDVDPAIRKPPPAVGTMPVVRPGELAPGTAK